MMKPFPLRLNLSFLAVVSTVLALAMPAKAHEVLPAVADMARKGDVLQFDIRLNVESLLVRVDLSSVMDINETPQADEYDAFRALGPDEIADRFYQFWPEMQAGITLLVDDQPVTAINPAIAVEPVGNIALLRKAVVSFEAPLPEDAQKVVFGWDAKFGAVILRQQGVDAPYDGFLQDGLLTEPIAIGPASAGGLRGVFRRLLGRE